MFCNRVLIHEQNSVSTCTHVHVDRMFSYSRAADNCAGVGLLPDHTGEQLVSSSAPKAALRIHEMLC